MGCILPGSSVHVIFQARILEWVAIFFSRGSYWPKDQTSVSYIGRRIPYPWTTRKPINLYTATIINFPNYHFDHGVPQYFIVSNAALLFHGPINEGTHSPMQWDTMGLLNVHDPFQPLTVCRHHALLAIPHSITACPRVEAHVGMLPRLVL